MILKWTAAWYELDQTIIVGDKDWFYLPSDENNHFFFNELYQSNSFIRKKLEIERITHPVLGNVKGIVTIGLDYTIYLTDGTMLEVNAEENPGQIYNSSVPYGHGWCALLHEPAESRAEFGSEYRQTFLCQECSNA